MVDSSAEKFVQAYVEQFTAQKRLGTAQEVADVVAFLCMSSTLTHSTLLLIKCIRLQPCELCVGCRVCGMSYCNAIPCVY